jgi:hypothetical protein
MATSIVLTVERSVAGYCFEAGIKVKFIKESKAIPVTPDHDSSHRLMDDQVATVSNGIGKLRLPSNYTRKSTNIHRF